MENTRLDKIIKNSRLKANSKEAKSFQKKSFLDKSQEKSFIEKENQESENINNSINCAKICSKPIEDHEICFDFRDEIEKRFRKSVVNKIYIFPRVENDNSLDDESSISSNSLIKTSEVYDLKSQNFKEKELKLSKEKEQEQKNLSFQDFLTKIQKDKDKWCLSSNNTSSLKKKPLNLNINEETLKKPLKTMKNSESVSNVLTIANKEEKRNEDLKKISVTKCGNKKLSNERDHNVKVIKGRKVIDLTNNSQQKINHSSVSRKKENVTTNVFHAINSFHNKLFPKEKIKKENSFQEFLHRKNNNNKKHISEIMFKNIAINNALKTGNNNLANNALYSKAKKQLLIDKEYENLYKSVEGVSFNNKEKILTENYNTNNTPKNIDKLGAFSEENRIRKEFNFGKKKDNNLQKSYDIAKNSFKDFLKEHSKDYESNKKTDRMIVLQNYLKENKR